MPCRTAALMLCARIVRLAVALGVAVCWGSIRAASSHAITIEFDYAYDASGFFGTAASPTPARTALEFAGRAFEPFFDSLAAIQPTGSDSWTATFDDPGTGVQTSRSNLVIPQNALRVFAGARNLTGAALAESGPGFYSFPAGSSPSPAFAEAVVNRGQGSSAADFAPWGGAIEFDTISSGGSPRNWHYDRESRPPGDAFDFYTVAVHELAHLLGFGTSSAYWVDVANGQFLGEAVTDVYGGPAPLHADNLHWSGAVGSPPYPAGSRPKPSLGPSLAPGERKLFTPLDYAALADIGWEVPPELHRLPGDANGDHRADGADFLAWQQNIGGYGGSPGDVDGDLFVDDYDGWLIRQSFGGVAGASGAIESVASTVPEPAASTLVVFATVWSARRRTKAS